MPRMMPVGMMLLLPLIPGCTENPVTPKPDTSGPAITAVLVPGHDKDGDSLIDLEIAWSDSNGIDVSSFRITALGDDGSESANLLPVWRLDRVDSAGAQVEEEIAGLLPSGRVQLRISVADKLGNRGAHVVDLNLPAGAFHKTIQSKRTWNEFHHGTNAVICNDGKLYVLAGFHLTIIHADSLYLIDEVRHPHAGEEMIGAACAEQPALLYAAGARRFDRVSGQWLPDGTAFRSHSVVASKRSADKLYLGEAATGGVGVYDRTSERRIGELPVPWNPGEDEAVFDIVVAQNDQKIYATRLIEGGILVIHPERGLLKRIALTQGSYPGRSDDIELGPDGLLLYAAVLYGDVRGVSVIDTRTDEVVRLFGIPNAVPQSIAVSPSGKRVFVTTQDLTATPSENVLMDTQTGVMLALFPRPRSARFRWDGGVVFHPNGKLIFVARDIHVDVYLNRE
jgi:hypothetical protein